MKLITLPNSFWGWPAPPPEELRDREVSPNLLLALSADRDGLAILEFADGRTLHSTTMTKAELLAILTAL